MERRTIRVEVTTKAALYSRLTRAVPDYSPGAVHGRARPSPDCYVRMRGNISSETTEAMVRSFFEGE
jgi:hypothetical protein